VREVFSLPQAAEFLGIEERTMRRWMVEHNIPHAKVGGFLRFRRAALLAWLKQRERERATSGRRRANDA